MFLYSSGPFYGIMQKGCTLIKKLLDLITAIKSKPVSCTNGFRKNILPILASCMTNLSEFHIVFSSNALLCLNKYAFEGHFWQVVNNFVKHN